MKISQFEVTPYSIPFVKSMETAGHTYSHREGVLLNLKFENLTKIELCRIFRVKYSSPRAIRI